MKIEKGERRVMVKLGVKKTGRGRKMGRWKRGVGKKNIGKV